MQCRFCDQPATLLVQAVAAGAMSCYTFNSCEKHRLGNYADDLIQSYIIQKLSDLYLALALRQVKAIVRVFSVFGALATFSIMVDRLMTQAPWAFFFHPFDVPVILLFCACWCVVIDWDEERKFGQGDDVI